MFDPRPSPLRPTDSHREFTAETLPGGLAGFVFRIGAADQVWLGVLSLLIAFLDTAPLEVQRRIINQTIRSGDFGAIVSLALVYAGIVFAHGLVKLVMNVYRGWVAENAIRVLRSSINTIANEETAFSGTVSGRGVEASMILSEAEPVGGFVAESVSEPLLQLGILASIAGYLGYLQPVMALVSLLTFAPQIVFVPLMQRAINRRVRERITTLRAATAGAVDTHTETIRLSQEVRFREVFHLNMGIVEFKYTLNFLMNLNMHLGMIGVLTLGGYYVVKGEVEVGTVVAFISGLRNVTDPWGGLVNWFQNAWVTSAKYDLMRRTVVALASDGPDAAAMIIRPASA
jgi:ABC-type bacteriocin/lantibiotic exporter with double-glycine peptidase domain